MARKPRQHVIGGFYHVMLRGNNGQKIFFNDADRCRFCLLLNEGTYRFNYNIHSFCLMSNHVHLAIQVNENPLSAAMQNISFRYTRWINRRMKRIGHLFQGRYKAILIDDDRYLLELVRYIHLNPVRANICTKPAAYQWSSHLTYIENDYIPWVSTKLVLSRFSSVETKAKSRYLEFMNKTINDELAIKKFNRQIGINILKDELDAKAKIRESNVIVLKKLSYSK